jgi:hypothetical protein
VKIIKLSYNATDIEKVYDLLNSAMNNLNRNFVGKTKIDIKNAIKKMEKIRPHLKNRGIR